MGSEVLGHAREGVGSNETPPNLADESDLEKRKDRPDGRAWELCRFEPRVDTRGHPV
jgi:hypothetical protein